MKRTVGYELFFVLLALLFIFVTVSLISYSSEDPSYSTVIYSRTPIQVHNAFGKVGAYAADFLGTALGWVSFLIPPLLAVVFINLLRLYRGKISSPRFAAVITLSILFPALLSVLSGVTADLDFYFRDTKAGGILGVAGATVLQDFLGKAGSVIFCFFFLLLSFMGLSGLTFTKLIRYIALKLSTGKERKKEKETPNERFTPEGRNIHVNININKPKMEEYAEDSYTPLIFDRLKSASVELGGRFKSALEKYRNRSVKEDAAPAPIPAVPAEVKSLPAAVPAVKTPPPLPYDPSRLPPPTPPAPHSDLEEELGMEEGAMNLPISKLEEILDMQSDREEERAKGRTEAEEAAEPNPDIFPMNYPEMADIELQGTEGGTRVTRPILEEEEKEALAQALKPDDEEENEGGGNEEENEEEEDEDEDLDSALSEVLERPVSFTEKPSAPSSVAVTAAQAVKPADDYPDYRLSLDLLNPAPSAPNAISPESLDAKADMLLQKLKEFGVEGKISEIHPGPVVTMFEFEPAPGIKINKIAGLENDMKLAMRAESIRIVAPIPGKAAIGIEVPNPVRAMISMRELLEADGFAAMKSPLAIALGKDAAGNPYFADLREMPHLLVAGTTGSGKSVCINTLITSIIYKATPKEVRFVMVDPKMVELAVYEDIPHLLTPVVTDPKKAATVLENVAKEMDERYKLMLSRKVRNILSYNELAKSDPSIDPMGYIVVIVDEFAELMVTASKVVEEVIQRLAGKARAAGIHIVLATQRPSVNVVTGVIKANMPARLAFKVASSIDSRTILEQVGGEQLLGKGDSIFLPPGSSTAVRIHGSFLSEAEVGRVVEALKVYGTPDYHMELLEDAEVKGGEDVSNAERDAFYEEAVAKCRELGFVSISKIQRDLGIGFNRASKIVEQMERDGYIDPSDGTPKPRKFKM